MSNKVSWRRASCQRAQVTIVIAKYRSMMLEAKSLRRAFGPVEAVRDVSFSIARGTMFGLLGPNGAGKTTTMRMVLGIVPPDGGSVTLDGVPVDGRSRRQFGYLPEERGLYGKMRVREHIMFFGRLHGMHAADARRETTRWIARLQLEPFAERACSELSKGNQQKVQIACAAGHRPTLLVLDEPYSGLDPVNAEMLTAALRELQRDGATLVLSSHQMWQIEELCSAFCIINGGRTRAAGTLAQLRSIFPNRTLRVAPASETLRALLRALPGAVEHAQNGTSLVFEIPREVDLALLLQRLVAAADVTGFAAAEPSLEAIYRHAIGAAVA